MKKILVPTDFSPAANGAVAYAAKLAKSIGADMTVFHAQVPDLFAASAQKQQAAADAIRQRLELICQEVGQVFRVSCSAEVQHGGMSLPSVLAAQGGRYDLVVMGTNGPDDLRQFFFGTHTYRTVTRMPIPLIVVPEGILYSEIRKIVYAFDYLRERRLPLDAVLAFARAVGAELVILQIAEEAYSPEVEEDLKALQYIIETYTRDFPLRFETRRATDITAAINSFADEIVPDVVALCSLHRSIAEKLIRHSVMKSMTAAASLPLFIFPERGKTSR